MVNIMLLLIVTSSSYQGPTITPVQNPWLPALQTRAQEFNVPVNNTYSIPYISSVRHSSFVPERYGGDNTRIEFSNGIAFDTKYLGKTGEPDLPADLKYDSRSDADYYIVQFSGPIYQGQKDLLRSRGITLHYYVPNYGFVCRIDDPAVASEIAAQPSVLWTGIYHPAYKISPLFNDMRGEFRVLIRLFIDADYAAVLGEVKNLTGRSDFETVDNGINKLIIGTIDLGTVQAIARMKSVYWVEPSLPLYTNNTNCQWVTQSGTSGVRNIWAKGIVGQGEITSSFDSGIHCPHFAKRSNSAAITTWGVYPTHNKIVAYDSGAAASIVFGDGAGSSYHGSHTAGTICGNDTVLGTNTNDGMAKYARHYFCDCGDNASSGIYTYGDLNDGWIRPYNKYYASNGIRAYSASNSWGSTATQVYNDQALQDDQFMWAHKDFCLFFSNGNSGSGAGTVNPPATGKNIVSVGATSDGIPATIAGFSSRGPTADGRYKPTICAPGNPLTSSTSGTGTYSSMMGTSMSCPAACGTAALARQYLREGWYPMGSKVSSDGWTYISAAMIKAILINSASNFNGENAPTNNIGWGIINLDSTLYFSSDATTQKLLLVDDTIGVLTGEQVDYHFSMPSGATGLKIALVWTDYPGNTAITRQIVNDVDLIVYGGGTTYRGNQYSGGYSVANPAGRDSINVEECAKVASPGAGDWRVTIQGRNIPYGPQPYALVIIYNGSAQAGVIKLNKPVYRCNDYSIVDTVRIRVEDTNYGSSTTRDSFRVVLSGKFTEIQPESVWVRETADSQYVFTGQIPLLFNKPVHADGRLSVCQGDTIFASYTDANPAYTTITWATVDAYYFVIRNVHAENIGANLADVCWTSNEGSNGTVYYGTTPALGSTVAVDTPYVMPHRVRLSGLTPRTMYYYDVMSKDFRGNIVRDNNDGRHYTFTTQSLAGIDILVALCDGNSAATNQGQALPGLNSRFQKAIQTGGWTYTWWQTSNYNGDLPPRTIARDYKAIFVPNEDEYPEFLPRQMDTIRYYEEGGCRIAFSSHDLLWYSWDPAGGNPQIGLDSMWCKNYMHCRYKGDIVATGSFRIYGVSGDPVTGNYTAGVVYSPHRSGADGDTVVSIDAPPNGWDTGGTSAYIWKWNAVAGNNVGNRWISGQNHGTPGQGVWGGNRTRTIMNAFSATQMDTLVLPNVLNDQFIWLIGHDHPDLTITSPVTGTTYSSTPISVAWTASYYGGAVNDSTWLEYSPDGGQTWFTIAAGTGITSPYSWNVSALQNQRTYQVKVTVSDYLAANPSLKGSAKTGNFTIGIAGNDDLGPKVVPNSIVVNNNPKYVTPTDTTMNFTAVVSDSETGLSNIAAAQWRIINSASGVGAMTAADGNFNAVLEQAQGTIRFQYSAGAVLVCSLQVRGQDNAALGEEAANWGGWYTRTFTLYDGIVRPIGVNEINKGVPTAYALYTAQPNPAVNRLTISFAIPTSDHVCLKVYNALGQLVRTLVNDVKKPGYYSVLWDGRDDTDRNVAAGIYFYQFTTNTYQDTKKAVLVK